MMDFIRGILVGYVFKNEAVHQMLRDLAKKTDNDLDDIGMEGLIAGMIKVADLLGK